MFHSSGKNLLSVAVSERVMDTGKDSISAFTELTLVESKAEIISY